MTPVRVHNFTTSAEG